VAQNSNSGIDTLSQRRRVPARVDERDSEEPEEGSFREAPAAGLASRGERQEGDRSLAGTRHQLNWADYIWKKCSVLDLSSSRVLREERQQLKCLVANLPLTSMAETVQAVEASLTVNQALDPSVLRARLAARVRHFQQEALSLKALDVASVKLAPNRPSRGTTRVRKISSCKACSPE